tara:strand:- start:845 stop:1135 length:291 start_codon:yes stop_codon:yes gene_type:complete
MKNLALLTLTAFAFSASAQTLSIDGNTSMNISSEQNLNASVGANTKASQAMGAIESGDIKGNTTMAIEAAQNLNAAVGDGSCADQQIGTIGKKSTC